MISPEGTLYSGTSIVASKSALCASNGLDRNWIPICRQWSIRRWWAAASNSSRCNISNCDSAVCRRPLLIRRLVCGASGEQISPECLELDCIGAAGFGRVDQPQGKIKRSVVVYPRLGNDEYVRHKISI